MFERELMAHLQEDTLAQRVKEARRHWTEKRQPGASPRHMPCEPARDFTITLAREAGTQGTAVARKVGELLGWHVYDHELLEHIAKEMGLRTALLESVDEKAQSWLLEMIEALSRTPVESEWRAFVSKSAFVHHLVETVLALGAHGKCVIVGRGAAFILPIESTLRVRLVGAAGERVRALSQHLGIAEREAAKKVRTIDRERSDFVEDYFMKDLSDPSNFDLVLNATRLSIDQCADLIVAGLSSLSSRMNEKVAEKATLTSSP